MSLSVDVDVDLSGSPIASGQGPAIMARWANEVLDDVASKGLSQVHLLMDQAFRNPTPYYETQVTVSNFAADRVIHDRGIIYGPWLEGVGSRNATSRFKGYSHWRRTRQWLNDTAVPAVIKAHIPDLISRLGG